MPRRRPDPRDTLTTAERVAEQRYRIAQVLGVAGDECDHEISRSRCAIHRRRQQELAAALAGDRRLAQRPDAYYEAQDLDDIA